MEQELVQLSGMTIPALVEWGQRSLAEAGSFEEVRKIKATAKALEAYQKSIGAAVEAISAAFEIRLRAENRMGEELEKVPSAQGRRSDFVPTGDEVNPTTEELGLTRKEATAYKALARTSPEQFQALLEGAKGGRVSHSKVVEVARAAVKSNWSPSDIKSAVREQATAAYRKQVEDEPSPPRGITAEAMGYKSNEDFQFSADLQGALQDLAGIIGKLTAEEAGKRLSELAARRVDKTLATILPWLVELRATINQEDEDAA